MMIEDNLEELNNLKVKDSWIKECQREKNIIIDHNIHHYYLSNFILFLKITWIADFYLIYLFYPI